MSKRKLSIMMVIVMVLSFTVACVDQGEKEDIRKDVGGEGQQEFLTIATGGTAGAYYPLGGALANIYNEIDGIIANTQATGASVENVGLISGKDREAQIAFIQNDVTYYAWEGIESFEGSDPIKNIRGLSVLYPEVIQIIATKDSGIKTVEDLKGKRVAVGAAGSGTEVNARQILQAYGISYEDINEDMLSFNEAADQLKNKQIDAAFVTAALPTSAVTEVTQTSDINLIPIDLEKINQLKDEYPFYTDVVIPGGIYKDNDEDVVAAAVMAMLVVPEYLEDDLAYELTKQLFEKKNIIEESHARGKDITLEGALEGMPIDVHPGALRYYEEQGIK